MMKDISWSWPTSDGIVNEKKPNWNFKQRLPVLYAEAKILYGFQIMMEEYS
jgi:hypothetical protein